ncbi:MAG: hypothetical protein ABL914_05805 [Novosphingobium sp.]|uniref:hypothetical protein n=1 Tax=Novosphingobium sp. TaxID=1874826 RepID=UPI0032BE7F4B
MKRFFSLAAASLLAISAPSPARADAVTSLLDSASYYLQLAASSVDLSSRVSARKEKCQWARQAQGEMAKAVGFYDAALQRAQTDWPQGDRDKLGQLVSNVHDQSRRLDELTGKLC